MLEFSKRKGAFAAMVLAAILSGGFMSPDGTAFAVATITGLRKYIEKATHETLDSLWAKVRPTVAAFDATDDRYIDIISTDIRYPGACLHERTLHNLT